jgi:hypothetical protein
MQSGGVCIGGFIVEPLRKPELAVLTIGMGVEYGHTGGGGHVGGECMGQRPALI